MKSMFRSVPLFGCFVLGLATAGCYDLSDPSTQDPTTQATSQNPSQTTSETSSGVDQTGIARTTLTLENQFSDQFTRGQIDRAALQSAIDDVIQAMPEVARPKVQQHIAWVLELGDKLAPQLTAEQRAAATAPPTDEKTRQTREAQVTDWGWPGLAGWGGYGAFAFPGMFYPYGVGYGYNPPGFNPYTGNPPGVGYSNFVGYPGYGALGYASLGYGYPGGGYGGYGGYPGYGGYGGYGGYPGYGYGGYGGYPGYGGYGGYGGFPGTGFGSGYASGYSYSYASGYSYTYGLGWPGWYW
jgi:hypothetical protein